LRPGLARADTARTFAIRAARKGSPLDQFPVIDASWQTRAEPGAIAGFLALDQVSNPPQHDGINELASALEAELRERFAGQDRAAIQETPPHPAYAAFYKRFGQRYHVGMQLDSVARKGKSLPRVAALVEAMFIAELRNGILTAGHDWQALTPPVMLGVGTGAETFTKANGETTSIKDGDLYTADAHGVLSAIISGPSALARIGPDTTNVLFVVYAPAGVEPSRVEAHLDELEANVRLISPAAIITGRTLVVAGNSGSLV
jgi:DNA/RNA-binding domain of Phe-tRNA-synthetase-like protein